MDESNATRVSTPAAGTTGPADSRALRPPQVLEVAITITTSYSATHLCGLLLEVLLKRGHQVEALDVRKHDALASYRRAARSS